MSVPAESMRRYAALLADELREARPARRPLGSPSELARELLPGYLLFKGRFGAGEEATAVYRAEVARALAGGEEYAVAAALDEIANVRRPGASEPARIRWRRLGSELLFGCALLGFGLIVRLPTAQATLSCQRPPSSPGSCATASCRLQWHVLFGGLPIRDTAIACLVGAEQVREEASGDTATNVYYKVMLSARDEAERYSMNPSGDFEPTLAASNRIRSFLAAPDQSTLSVVLSPTGFEKWMARLGDCLLVLGLVTVLSVPVQIMRSWFAGT